MSGEEFKFDQEQDSREQNRTIGAETLAQMPEFDEHMKELEEIKLNPTNEFATEKNSYSETLDDAEIYKKYEEELKGIDYNIQLALSQQEGILKRLSGGEEVIQEIKLSVARGEYREAYMSKRTGEILFGDEANRTMNIELHDWHSDEFDRDGFDELSEEEKKNIYRKAIDKKLWNLSPPSHLQLMPALMDMAMQ